MKILIDFQNRLYHQQQNKKVLEVQGFQYLFYVLIMIYHAPPQRVMPIRPSAIVAQPIQLSAERRSFKKIAEQMTLKKSTPALSKVKSSVVLMPLLISAASRMIADEELVKLGYTNVKEFGGIIDWEYETTK